MICYEGSKVRLRPIRSSDMAQSIRWRNDPEVRERALGYRFPVTEAMERRWYDAVMDDQSRTRVVFAVEALDDDALVGFIQLNRIDWISRTSYLGLVIGEKDRQGQGMGTDATSILLKYAFDCLNLRKVCLEVAAYNPGAIELYRRLGFRKEGALRAQVYLEGTCHDLVLMGLLASDFHGAGQVG